MNSNKIPIAKFRVGEKVVWNPNEHVYMTGTIVKCNLIFPHEYRYEIFDENYKNTNYPHIDGLPENEIKAIK